MRQSGGKLFLSFLLGCSVVGSVSLGWLAHLGGHVKIALGGERGRMETEDRDGVARRDRILSADVFIHA